MSGTLPQLAPGLSVPKMPCEEIYAWDICNLMLRQLYSEMRDFMQATQAAKRRNCSSMPRPELIFDEMTPNSSGAVMTGMRRAWSSFASISSAAAGLIDREEDAGKRSELLRCRQAAAAALTALTSFMYAFVKCIFRTDGAHSAVRYEEIGNSRQPKHWRKTLSKFVAQGGVVSDIACRFVAGVARRASRGRLSEQWLVEQTELVKYAQESSPGGEDGAPLFSAAPASPLARGAADADDNANAQRASIFVINARLDQMMDECAGLMESAPCCNTPSSARHIQDFRIQEGDLVLVNMVETVIEQVALAARSVHMTAPQQQQQQQHARGGGGGPDVPVRALHAINRFLRCQAIVTFAVAIEAADLRPCWSRVTREIMLQQHTGETVSAALHGMCLLPDTHPYLKWCEGLWARWETLSPALQQCMARSAREAVTKDSMEVLAHALNQEVLPLFACATDATLRRLFGGASVKPLGELAAEWALDQCRESLCKDESLPLEERRVQLLLGVYLENNSDLVARLHLQNARPRDSEMADRIRDMTTRIRSISPRVCGV